MNNKLFVVNLIEFYKESLGNSAHSIKKLAELQENYPKEYELFKQSSLDPSALPELLKKLDDESRGILIDIYFRQETLSKKAQLLLQMSANEKKKYAKELEEFGKIVDEKVSKLMKKSEKND